MKDGIELLSKSCLDFIHEINKTNENRVISCHLKTPLDVVIPRISLNKIHRLYVIDSHNKATHIITSRDIITCLLNNLN
jgi:predicted transcriptional regulator